MLEALFGSPDAERVLFYLAARGSGYGKEIATFWQTNTSTGILRQLEKLEAAGIVKGSSAGRTRVYTWNDRWPFKTELLNLLQKSIAMLPPEERNRLVHTRRRPRRQGKPIEIA